MSLFLMFVGGALFGLWVGYLEGRRVGFAQGKTMAARNLRGVWAIAKAMREARSDVHAGDTLTRSQFQCVSRGVEFAATIIEKTKR